MAQPEEFTIHIEPDGRIVLEGEGLSETSYRKIIELLEETIGPVREIQLSPQDPPRRHYHLSPSRPSATGGHLDLGRQTTD